MAMSPLLSCGVGIVGVLGTSMVMQSTPLEKPLLKHASWVLLNACVGATLSPLCILGGPLLARAAMMTGATVGGLSLVAACAPHEKFLNYGGAMAIGLGVVVASSLGTMFLGPMSAAGGVLHAVSLYGGTVLFGGFVLY